MSLLFDIDAIGLLVKEQEDLIASLKLALVANDSKRLPMLYPAFAPAPPPDNIRAIEAIDRDEAVEIVNSFTAAEAMQVLSMLGDGELNLEDLLPGGGEWS